VGVEAAVVAGDDGDVALFQERGGEADGVGDFCAGDGFAEIGADVGGSSRRPPWGRTQRTLGRAERRSHMWWPRFSNCWRMGFDGFGARGSLSARAAGGLSEAGDVAGHLALEFVDGVDGGLGAANVADAPSRSIAKLLLWQLKVSVCFEQLRVQGVRSLTNLRVAVDELFIDLIGGRRTRLGVLDDHVGKAFELGGGIGVAAGIAGAVSVSPLLISA